MVLVSLWQGVLQTNSIVLPHLSSVSQTSSNRKGLDNGDGSMPLGTIQIGTWSDVVQLKCITFVLANFCSHSLVQKALSSLSHTDCPFEKCLLHVNFVLEYPRSINPQASTVNVQIVYKTLWTFRPPNNKLPIQA